MAWRRGRHSFRRLSRRRCGEEIELVDGTEIGWLVILYGWIEEDLHLNTICDLSRWTGLRERADVGC